MTTSVQELQLEDRVAWMQLARGYKDFYKTPIANTEYEEAWKRLLAKDDVFGLGARQIGRLVGIAHYLFHTSTWTQTACYLQDLFTTHEARGTASPGSSLRP